jgi:hypothetical protein
METKKLSNPVIDFFRNDIVWLVFYLAFAATVVNERAICCGIGSIAWVYLDGTFYRDVRRIVQAAGRGDFPLLKLGAKNRKAAEHSPARQVRHYVHRFAPVVPRSIPLTLLSSASDLQFHDRQA